MIKLFTLRASRRGQARGLRPEARGLIPEVSGKSCGLSRLYVDYLSLKFLTSFRLHIVDIVTKVALGKQRQTYEYSSKRKLMDRCMGLSFGSTLAVVWGFWGFWACFCWFHVPHGWPGSILGAFWD